MKQINFKLLSILFIVFAMAYTAIFIYNNQRVEKQIQHELQSNVKKAKNNLKASLFQLENISRNIYHFIGHNQEIIELLKQAGKTVDEEDKKIYRDKLYALLKEPFKRIQNIGADKFHFVLPDKKSFLRVCNPEKYGDDLSHIRETYNYVFKEKKPINAFEKGKYHYAYRFVYPIFDKQGDIVAAFELSFIETIIQKNLRKFSNMHNHFLVKKSVSQRNELSTQKKFKNYIQSIEHEGYLFNPNESSKAHEHIQTFEEAFINPNKEFIKRNMDEGREFSFYIKYNKSIETLIFLPVKNLKNSVMAYIVIYQEDKFSTEALHNNKILNMIMFISLVGFFITLYYLIERKNILQIEVEEQTKELKKSADIISKFVIYSKTDLQGYITEVSDAFCKVSGYTKDELIGQNHDIVRHPDYENHPIIKEMYEVLEKEQVWMGKFKNITKQGDTYWLKSIISPEYNEDGKLKGYVGFREDISDKKALEHLNNNLESLVLEKVEENMKQKKQLLQQEKTVALGNMMDAIAHQWKQPLSIISMEITNICLKYELGEEITKDEYFALKKEVTSQIDHLVHTIDEFRAFFRPNKKVIPMKIKDLINDTLVLMKNSIIKYNIDIKIEGDKTIEIECIPTEFKHVFINLINNSKDAFNENNIKNRSIIFNVEKIKDNVILKICDNAGGIPKDIIENIFDSNFTTKEEGKGTGIGLYLVKQIIEKLDGTIKAENSDDGACFIIDLKSKEKLL